MFAFSDEDDLLFRGHKCESWELKPGLARLELRREVSLRNVEDRLIADFKRQCLPHIERDLRDEWDVLAMAQHHGLATRLLDWTANPLAALWFAVREPAAGREPGVVLMFQPVAEDYVGQDRGKSPYSIKATQFFQPSHLNSRIVAQNGWFSVHAWSSGRATFNRLDRLTRYKGRIERLRIRGVHFSDLRGNLDRLGVNEATMFPGLDGLATHLNWIHSVLSDEH